MPPVPFSIYSKSKPFKFIVGPDNEEFLIHSGLIGQQSDALNALVNSGMKESSELCAHWKEVDVETFYRFGDFVYKGTYTEVKSKKRQATEKLDVINSEDDGTAEVPEPYISPPQRISADIFLWTRLKSLYTEPESPKKAEEPPPPDEDQLSDELRTISKKLKKKKKRAKLSCSDFWVDPESEQAPEEPALEPEPVKEVSSQNEEADLSNQWNLNYTDVFLSHARLYVLGDYYGIDSLQTLALYKLHKALLTFTLYEEGVSDIAELVKYTFINTVDKADGSECLRELVALYVACHLNHLWKDKSFRDFVVDIPELGNYLITDTLTRL